MIVAIAGAHGKISIRLTGLLTAGGDEVVGLIRNPNHAEDIVRQGASPVVCDLEREGGEEIAAAIAGSDAAEVVGLTPNPTHAADRVRQGASPVVCDLEREGVEEIAAAIAGSDAAVFAAGAGPGSGAERKLTMDRDGAIKLLGAAASVGVRR